MSYKIDLLKLQKQKFVFCLTIVLIFSLQFFSGSSSAADWKFKAARVFDGDTIMTASGEKIRLKGIDAPEKAHGGKKAQFYSKESRRALWDLVKGRELRIDTREIKADRYGRVVAYVYLPTGETLSMAMIKGGNAFFYPHSKNLDEREKEMVQEQKRAMYSLRGCWARVMRVPEAGYTYYGSRKSRRFHRTDCPFGKKIKSRNRVVFSSLSDAFGSGYAPCRTCTVWPQQ